MRHDSQELVIHGQGIAHGSDPSLGSVNKARATYTSRLCAQQAPLPFSSKIILDPPGGRRMHQSV